MLVVLLAGAALFLVPAVTPARAASPASFLVGADAEDLAPQGAKLAQYVAAKDLYLGGYGIGSGGSQIGPLGTTVPCVDPSKTACFNPRYATGVMNGPHVFVRAVVVSDGTHTVAFADLDTQGMFAAYRINPANLMARPYGIDDIRSEVAKATGGGLAFNNITISGDHSHAGEDTIGVWGFVPDEYLAFIKSQAVKALETAYANRQPALIKEGAVPTPGPCASNRILNDQFDCQTPPNDVMDPELRTMQAIATGAGHVVAGGTIMTLVNFAAHATVMGGGNTLLSPDWPGVVGQMVQDKYGGVGLTIVGAVGRSQPNRGDCTATDKTSGAYLVDPRQLDDSCRLSKYSAAVMAYVDGAVRAETPITVGAVDGRELFIHDPADNAGILAFNYLGDPIGVPVARAQTPPYLAGNVLGTWVGVYRIGDVVLTTNPGEPYPNIRQQFMQAVPGARRYWTTGLSNDQLGYLIAPFPEGYPQAIQAGAGGNDNILFNISATLGDHVMCTQVKGALDMGLPGTSPAKCAVFAAEPNIYGPGGVDPGPAGAANPPPTDFQGRPVASPRPASAGAATGSGRLPQTGTQDPRLLPLAGLATLVIAGGAGALLVRTRLR
ncbi:MAG: LPXTG cell wall anchor domain-containing protein [Candidatus Dormibacteria bacterium]